MLADPEAFKTLIDSGKLEKATKVNETYGLTVLRELIKLSFIAATLVSPSPSSQSVTNHSSCCRNPK